MCESLSRITGFKIYYSEKDLVESGERNGPSWQYSAFKKLRKVRIARVSFSMARHPSMIFPYGLSLSFSATDGYTVESKGMEGDWETEITGVEADQPHCLLASNPLSFPQKGSKLAQGKRRNRNKLKERRQNAQR